MPTILIHENTFEKARNAIKKHLQSKDKNNSIIFSSDDEDVSRKILEKEKINVLLINQKGRKDFQKQRNSGLDNVMAKEAKKSNVVIGINLDEILNSRDREKIEIFARIRQNIELCKKNRLKMVFVSKEKKDLYDLKSLALVLGMPTWMTSSLTLELLTD
ncbi:MAG: RNase P subunit p30 family protein [Nanoarchaeota archaeon]